MELAQYSVQDVETQAIHQALRQLALELRQRELRLAELLAQMEARGGYRLWAASMREYMEQLGLDRGKGGALLRIGRALPALPTLRNGMADGTLAWTKARELVRVATPETHVGWVRLAEQKTVRQLEAIVRRHEPGDEAPNPDTMEPVPERVHFGMQMTPAQKEMIGKALVLARAVAGDRDMDGADALVMLAEHFIASEADGASLTAVPFKTVLQVCPDCDASRQVGLPDEPDGAEVPRHVREMARCDALVIDLHNQGALNTTVSPRVRELALVRDDHCCAVPGCRNNFWLHLHHVVPRSEGGPNAVGNLICLCSRHHAAVHLGLLIIEPDLCGGFSFDLTVAGWPPPRGSAPPKHGGCGGLCAATVTENKAGHQKNTARKNTGRNNTVRIQESGSHHVE